MKTPIETFLDGAIIVNSALVTKKHHDIACIELDCVSKYPVVVNTTSGNKCGLTLGADENTLHKNINANIDDLTIIHFPEFAGWKVFAISSGRYTISICLIK